MATHGGSEGIARRGLLLAAAGSLAGMAGLGVLVDQDVLPGRTRAYRALGLNGDGAGFPSADPPGQLVHGTFTSSAAGGVETGWTVGYPSGISTDTPLPVAVLLHGASYDHRMPFEDLGLDRFLNRLVAAGLPPFALASVDGDRTYWRPGPLGDTSRMVTDEFVPLLAARGLDVSRLALCGWSMGGYGALRLAGLDRLPWRTVVAVSPALSRTPPTGDADDDVFGHPERLDGVDLRIDCGHGDPFYPVVHDFVGSLSEPPAGAFGAGAHTESYWRAQASAELEYLGRALR